MMEGTLPSRRPLRRPVDKSGQDGKNVSAGPLITALAVGATPALALGILVSKEGMGNPWVLPLAAITLMVNIFIIMSDIRMGLALFLMAAGMSPKLPGLYDNLRVEDFVFAVTFLVWFGRAMNSGRLPQLRSPLLTPFLVLTGISIFSTFWGIAIGTVPDIKYSFFLQVKRIEYFLIFWIVTSTIRSEGWLRLLTLVFAASGAVAAIYGLINPESSYGQSVAATRVMGPEGENYNTLAGYLVICIGAGLSAVAGFPRGRQRLFLMVATSISLIALLMTFSREGYIMMLGAVVVFGMSRFRVIALASMLLFIVIGFVFPPVRQNLLNTVGTIQSAQTDDPGSNSLTARYRSWEYRWNGWFIKQPLIGNGVGSVALSVDNEYLLRMCEVGLLGFGVFLWFLASISRQIIQLQKIRGLPQVLSLGLAAGFVGLLIQALVAASFTSIRTMEPFWFLLGLVTAATAIHRANLQQTQSCVS